MTFPKSSFHFFCILLSTVLLASFAKGEPTPLSPAPERPGMGTGPTKISVSAWFADISKIDSASQSFSGSLLFMMQWKDPSLVHPGPDVKSYPLEQIWHPRWIIANAGESLRSTLPETVDVAPDGHVVYRQRLIGAFNEQLNLRRFPFDKEVFCVQLVVLGCSARDVKMVPDAPAISAGMPEAIGRSQLLTMQDWTVSSVNAHNAPYTLVPGTELAGYSFSFSASRRPQHYLLKVILPLVLIVMMSWMVFWIDPTLGASQISVAVTSMLTLIAYRFAIGNDVPKLPYLTLLDAFILIATILVFLSLIEVMITTTLAVGNRVETARTIDRHSRWVFPAIFVLLTAVLYFF